MATDRRSPKRQPRGTKWPADPRPAITPGDTVTVRLRPIFGGPTGPVKVLRVEPSRFAVSGWAIVVATDDGPRSFGSTLCAKVE